MTDALILPLDEGGSPLGRARVSYTVSDVYTANVTGEMGCTLTIAVSYDFVREADVPALLARLMPNRSQDRDGVSDEAGGGPGG